MQSCGTDNKGRLYSVEWISQTVGCDMGLLTWPCASLAPDQNHSRSGITHLEGGALIDLCGPSTELWGNASESHFQTGFLSLLWAILRPVDASRMSLHPA